MITVNIEYQCDKCGKKKKEETIIKQKGYDEVQYLVQDEDAGYMPDEWVTDHDNLWCPKCGELEIDDDAIVSA
jgi:predicted nucleic-acid-binding Zn-ribbon protein